MAGDPIQAGIVDSLGRPGGNITGSSTLSVQVGSKRLELLHQLLPTASVIALLVNPADPINAETQSGDLLLSGRRPRTELHVLHARTEHDFETVFATCLNFEPTDL